MKLTFQYGEDQIVLHVEPDGDGWRVRLPDGSEHKIMGTRLADDVLQVSLRPPQLSLSEGEQGEARAGITRIFHVPCARTERGIELSWEGETYVFQSATVSPTGADRRAHSGSLAAPMVGVVAEVMVEEGQRVEAYQPLAVVEAMKVMATVEAPFAGTVAKVYVQKGERVTHGAPVVDVTPD